LEHKNFMRSMLEESHIINILLCGGICFKHGILKHFEFLTMGLFTENSVLPVIVIVYILGYL
jgi:hypothetical protein